jgi:hypothetical protein
MYAKMIKGDQKYFHKNTPPYDKVHNEVDFMGVVYLVMFYKIEDRPPFSVKLY